MTKSNRGGLILCGGQSKRLGTPKAWLLFDDVPLLTRVAQTLLPLVQELRVIGAPETDYPLLPEGVILESDPTAYQGPAPGLVRGLQQFSPQIDSVFVCSCDLPFLNPACVEFLFDQIGTSPICIPTWKGYRHPLCAVYQTKVATGIEWQAWQNRRVIDFVESVGYHSIPEEVWHTIDPNGLALTNINSPEDYAIAMQKWPTG